MRIAAKRLRYTLELARPVYNSDLAETIDAVKRLQTLLGEVHDCDVWGAVFEEFERKELGEIQFHFGNSRRFERLHPGLAYLKQERKERRCHVFDELAAYWRELSDQARFGTALPPSCRIRAARSGRSRPIRARLKSRSKFHSG